MYTRWIGVKHLSIVRSIPIPRNVLLISRMPKAMVIMSSWILLGYVSLAPSCFACGGIFDVECNLRNGGLSPENIAKQGQQAVQDVGNAVNELQANLLTGPTLEQAIIGSRNTAINGSLPIPPDIRRQLTGYASEDSMNRVRFKIGDNGFFNLARLLEQGGFASAVTLIDVIVFRGPSEAADPSIWAHELTHVDQFAHGTQSFTVRYARNWRSIEDPAYEKGNGFWSWKQRTRNDQSDVSFFQQQQQTGFPSNYGMQVCGCWGPNPIPVVEEPRCASGRVRTNLCPGSCAPGHPPYAYVCQ